MSRHKELDRLPEDMKRSSPNLINTLTKLVQEKKERKENHGKGEGKIPDLK